MSVVEPSSLPEAGSIIGDRWPAHDETAYEREAQVQRQCAQSVQSVASHTHTAAGYTQPHFRGQGGEALATQLSARHEAHNADEARHINVAGWLDIGARNIAEAKTAINAAVTDYHEAYGDAQRRADEETWSQQQLATVKATLMQRAQDRVGEIRVAFDESHAAIAAGISAAAPPTVPAAMSVY